MRKGLLFVVSAPSGAGKTSLLENILADSNDDLVVAVSHTSRQPREGEIEGSSYYFISISEFERMIQTKSFIEYAQVYGNYYGTSEQEIKQKRSLGKHVILEIDVQGAGQIKVKFPDAVLIFIVPPSLQALQQRLESRQTDSVEGINVRAQNAKLEIKEAINFDYLVVNDDFYTAKHDLQCIFRAEQLAVSRNQDKLEIFGLTQ